MRNKLNDLTNKDWLLFQKSWFVHNPRPRSKTKLLHPATFPEEMAREFVEFFTKAGQVVFDPMCGTGSTLVGALAAGREAVGMELSEEYAAIARSLAPGASVHCVDAMAALDAYGEHDAFADYVFTSPPYWDMLRRKGGEGQEKRRSSGLDVFYSDDPRDFGNIENYPTFLATLVDFYVKMKKVVVPGGYVTIVVKNIKKQGKIYPLAWDLARYLSVHYTMKDEKIWCQDNQRLFPFALGSAWVSNTFHHYCLIFQKEKA